MDLRLTGRVAIVAAASKGLGRAVAEALAHEGAHVAVCARTASTLRETAVQIQKTTGCEVLHQALDVTDSAAVAAFVAAVEVRLGRIDICVTNSAGPPSNSFKSTSRKTGAPPLTSFDEHHFFRQGNFAAHAEKQVATPRARPIAFECDPRRPHRSGAHACK